MPLAYTRYLNNLNYDLCWSAARRVLLTAPPVLRTRLPALRTGTVSLLPMLPLPHFQQPQPRTAKLTWSEWVQDVVEYLLELSVAV